MAMSPSSIFMLAVIGFLILSFNLGSANPLRCVSLVLSLLGMFFVRSVYSMLADPGDTVEVLFSGNCCHKTEEVKARVPHQQQMDKNKLERCPKRDKAPIFSMRRKENKESGISMLQFEQTWTSTRSSTIEYFHGPSLGMWEEVIETNVAIEEDLGPKAMDIDPQIPNRNPKEEFCSFDVMEIDSGAPIQRAEEGPLTMDVDMWPEGTTSNEPHTVDIIPSMIHSFSRLSLEEEDNMMDIEYGPDAGGPMEMDQDVPLVVASGPVEEENSVFIWAESIPMEVDGNPFDEGESGPMDIHQAAYEGDDYFEEMEVA